MKKVLLFLIVCSIFPGHLSAQELPIKDRDAKKAISGEVYLGAGIPVYKMGAISNQLRPMIGLELRYNFANSPFDLGFGARSGLFTRLYEESRPAYASIEIYFAADYNYRVNRNLVLFAGVEGGVSVPFDLSRYNARAHRMGSGMFDVPPDSYYTPKGVSPFIAPRVGLVAWNHLRCTLAYDIVGNGGGNVNFRVGYTF
ncbi:MAG: hypothetical protein IJV37_03470 [Bacteroidales bacterium]|nr:hypothetical protein [Bacteroidales bacterium]